MAYSTLDAPQTPGSLIVRWRHHVPIIQELLLRRIQCIDLRVSNNRRELIVRLAFQDQLITVPITILSHGVIILKALQSEIAFLLRFICSDDEIQTIV